MADQAEPGNKPPKRRRLPLIIGAVVLLVLLGAGGYVWQSRHSGQAKADTAEKADAPDKSKREIYLALEPAFVVTFREGEGDSLRYLQVGVTLMAHDEKAISTAKDADPVVRDGLVSLFSSQKFDVVSQQAGREKLQADALATVRKIVQKRLGRPGIDALYFTSFVIQ